MKFLRIILVALPSSSGILADTAVFELFEGDSFGMWKETGSAFGEAPSNGGHGAHAKKVLGYANESLASSFAEGEAGMGSLTSPLFLIEAPYLSFLVGGGSLKGLTSVQLIVEEKIMREATGQDDTTLRPRTWDLRDLKGKQARLRLVDAATGVNGFILADHILFSRNPEPRFPGATRGGKPFIPGLVSSDTLPGVHIPEGSRLEIYADHDQHGISSPTSLCIVNSGRILVTETHRLRHGIPDNRNQRYWITDDLAAQGIEDRRRMHQKWNGKYPVAKMTEVSEIIRLLQDTDRDGKADRTTVFANGFNDLLDGAASGIYSLSGQVYFACVPHIWSLRDTNGDGISDTRRKLFSGFAPRVSLPGHDLSGFSLGPDGRIYGAIGDRAMNVTTPEGQKLAYTDQGTVFRFEPDGSNFEVIHAGLRNPGDLSFDQWGNLISVDGNLDEDGRARIVYVMDGADSGWRTDHQNLYSFYREIGCPERPINQWIQEQQWDKHHEEQPAFIVPPVALLGSGTSGLTYQPGTGFAINCKDSFLACDYQGDPAASGIWAFSLEQKGAGLRMANARKFHWGAAVTDVEFGYDGRLYVADFVKGWKAQAAGRIYTLSSEDSLSAPRTREVADLLGRERISQLPPRELFELMKHPDFRVRLRAQLALVNRPEAIPYFINATRQNENRHLALHGVWGLWIKARRSQSEASRDHLVELLGHPEEEIRSQAARALGEAPLQDHGRLVSSLQDPSTRVRAFAASSLARLRAPSAFIPTLVLLAENADKDPYLRHAGVVSLTGSGSVEQIAALASHPNKSIRLAAVVALRRLRSPEVVRFFFDEEHPAISDEAIRAAHDVPIEKARPAVAALLDEYAPEQGGRPLSRMMLRRLLHSAFRAGGPRNAARLLRAAANETLDLNERLEALRLLSLWTDPPKVDQSLGRYAPLAPRDLAEIKPTLEQEIRPLLRLEGKIRVEAMKLVNRFELSATGLKEDALASLPGFTTLGGCASIRRLDRIPGRAPGHLSGIPVEATRKSGRPGAGPASRPVTEKYSGRSLVPGRESPSKTHGPRARASKSQLAGSAEGPGTFDIGSDLPDHTTSEVDQAAGLGQRINLCYLPASHIPPDTIFPAVPPIAVETGEKGFWSVGIEEAESEHHLDASDEGEGQKTGESNAQAQPGATSVSSRLTGPSFNRPGLSSLVDWLSSVVGGSPPALRPDATARLEPTTFIVDSPQSSAPADPAPEGKIIPGAVSSPEISPAPAAEPDNRLDPGQMQLGKETYNSCIACHGDRGQGISGGAGGPPLASSEWVVGPPENLIRIQLRGLRDDITVNGRQYVLGVDINPAGMVAQLQQTDEQIAAVLTYIRNSWGNEASPIRPELVRQFRSEVGKPQLKVEQLIAPSIPEGSSEPVRAATGRPSGPARSSTGGFRIKTVLIPVALLGWCSLCALPLIRQIKARRT